MLRLGYSLAVMLGCSSVCGSTQGWSRSSTYHLVPPIHTCLGGPSPWSLPWGTILRLGLIDLLLSYGFDKIEHCNFYGLATNYLELSIWASVCQHKCQNKQVFLARPIGLRTKAPPEESKYILK